LELGTGGPRREEDKGRTKLRLIELRMWNQLKSRGNAVRVGLFVAIAVRLLYKRRRKGW
jgi:hypothetical protein